MYELMMCIGVVLTVVLYVEYKVNIIRLDILRMYKDIVEIHGSVLVVEKVMTDYCMMVRKELKDVSRKVR